MEIEKALFYFKIKFNKELSDIDKTIIIPSILEQTIILPATLEQTPINVKITYFKHRTDILTHLDLQNLYITEHKLNLPEIINSRICLCKIPNGDLFCYGNRISLKFSGIAFIITKDNLIKNLPKGKPCTDAGAVYYDDNIYTFGGFDGKDVKLAHKFSLTQQK